MSMAHNYVNIKEPYNQDIKKLVTTKNFPKKKTGFTLNSQPQRHSVQNELFKFNHIFCSVNFLNNISITQIKVNERKTDLIRPLKPLNRFLPPHMV